MAIFEKMIFFYLPNDSLSITKKDHFFFVSKATPVTYTGVFLS